MPDPIQIKVEPRAARTLTFRIGDEDYSFKVPKSYGLVSAVRAAQAGAGAAEGQAEVAMFDRIEGWLFDSMAEGEADRLRARLLDPDDALDTEHILEVFQELVKAASDRPSQ
jgi:hypothetical protein